MRALLRLLVVALVLSESGAAQAWVEAAEGPCCEEEGSPVPDCPPGADCACCPIPSSPVRAEVRLIVASVEGVRVDAPEPVASAYRSDIFQPPKA
jgi:hypothetical protein